MLKKSDLTFLGFDFWCRPVYKHINGKIFKDISLLGNENNVPNILHDTADNTFDGEPNNPYKFN